MIANGIISFVPAAAVLWREGRDTFEIAKALDQPESEVSRLLPQIREEARRLDQCEKTRERLARFRERHGGSHSKTWNAANPEKRKAQKAVENALMRGDLTKSPCERCGSNDAHAHHDDYSKPLDVMWLCPKHHKERHRELRNCEAA